MATIRKAFFINLAQNYGIIVLQFVASVILARLLSPAEIGVFSVAATLVGLAQAVRDFGVGQYIIQEKDLTKDRVSAAFTVSFLVAVVLAAITASLCNVISEFYREPGVRNVMLVLALNFLLIPLGQITLGCLQREMKFGIIAKIKIGSAIAHFITSIGLAFLGFSYMSLAIASLVGVLTSAGLANLHRPKDMPWTFSIGEVRRVVSFGSFAVLTNIAGALSKGGADLVLGRMIGMNSVGLFSRASGLIEIFNQAIMNSLWSVALPHFAKVVREEGDISQEYLNSACLITGVAWPFFAVLILLAEPMVLLLYGPAWIECVPLIRWICVAFLIISPFYLFSSVLMALGLVKKIMWIEVGTLPFQIGFCILGAVLGGLEMVAAANVVFSAIKAGVIYYVLQQHLVFCFHQFYCSLWRSLLVMFVCTSICFLSLYALGYGFSSIWLQLVFGGIAAIIGLVTGLFVVKHPLRLELLSILQRFMLVYQR